MTFLLLKIAGLMVLAAGFGAWVARWFFRHRYEDVTVQYTGWQNEWAQWRKGLDSKLSLRQMIDLSPVTERMNELESLVRGFGMPKPPPVDLAPVMEAVQNIRVPQAPTYDFTPLYSRMYQIEQCVASIRVPDLAPLHDRLDTLEASMQRSVAAIDIPKPIPTDLSPVFDGLSTIERSIGSLRIPDLAPVMSSLASLVESNRNDLAPLYDRMNQVDKAVRDLPQPERVDLAPLVDRVAAVDAHVGALHIPPAPNLQPLQARLDALEKAVVSIPMAIAMPNLDLTPVHSRLADLERAMRDTVAAIPAPVPPKETDWGPVLDRVASVEGPLHQRLGQMESRIESLRTEPPPPLDLGPVQARIDAMEASLAALRTQAADFAPLETRFAQLEANLARRVTETVASMPAPVAPKEISFAPLIERLAAVESRVLGIRMPPPQPSVNLTPLHDKLDSLSRVVGAIKPSAPVAAAPVIDLTPMRSSLEKRLDSLETAVSAIRMPTSAPPVDIKPLFERMQGLEGALTRMEARMEARIDSNARAESMSLRRSSAAAATATPTVVESPPPRPPAAPPAAMVPATSAPLAPSPAVKPQAAASRVVPTVEPVLRKTPATDAESSQLGLGFDTRQVRPGSRNLLTSAAFGKGDDLKAIVGVAVGLERLLHEIGVYYFWQIAEWTPDDVAYVDSKLKAFKGRILRDAWVTQCTKLVNRHGAARKPT